MSVGAKALGCEGAKGKPRGSFVSFGARRESSDLEETLGTGPVLPTQLRLPHPSLRDWQEATGSRAGRVKEVRTGAAALGPSLEVPKSIGKGRLTLGLLPSPGSQKDYWYTPKRVPQDLWDSWGFKHRSSPTPIVLPGGWDTQPEQYLKTTWSRAGTRDRVPQISRKWLRGSGLHLSYSWSMASWGPRRYHMSPKRHESLYHRGDYTQHVPKLMCHSASNHLVKLVLIPII